MTPISDLFRSLGFCCTWAGLKANKDVSSELLGLRLGCTGRAIRYCRAALDSGDVRCQHYRDCLKEKIDAKTKNV